MAMMTIGKLACDTCDNGSSARNAALLGAIAIEKGASS